MQVNPKNGNGQKQANEEIINLREILENYLIYWKWIVASAVVFLFIGGIYLMTQERIYEFRASVLVIDPKSQMNEMSILSELKQMGITTSRNAANNEERVLKSTHLMKRVVNYLGLHTRYEAKQRLHKVDLYTNSPYRAELDSAAQYALPEDLIFTIGRKDGKYHIAGEFAETEFEFTPAKLPATILTPAGRVKISRTEKEMEDESQKIFVTISQPDRIAQWLATSGIKTEIDKMADEIWITFHSNNVQKGKDVLNQLVRLYNRDAVEQITQSAIFSSIFIDGRLVLLEDELTDVEQKIENYKKTNELTNIESDAELFLKSNSDFYNLQIETEIQVQLVEYVEKYLKTTGSQYSMIPDPGLRDRGLVAVITKYNELLMMRDKVIQGSSPTNPMLVAMNSQLESTRLAIREGINNVKKGLQIQNKELTGQNTLLRTRLKDIPRQEREFVEIKRQQQVKEALYVFLLQKKEEASLSMAIATNKARLLNAPDDAKQVAPRAAVIMAVFMLLGIFLPIGVIFVRNILNTTITNRSDVEKLTNLPILSELAHNNTPDAIFDHRSTDIANAELFRLLRAKLQFVLDDPEKKVVLVTSTQPGEGKTFVSVNLAISLSLMEKRVLLVGLDLRKPMVSKLLNITAKDGITAYLSGQIADPKKLIQNMEDYPNLDVLPAGVIPPNPNELIMNDKFDKIFADLRNDYDFIVLDTSPVGAVSDTYLIDRVADLCLYVTRSEYSDKRNIEYINRLDREGTLRRIYLVINDVKFESNKYAYYRKYGYGYGYSYGYGQGKK